MGKMKKSLNICDANPATENIPDIGKYGDPDRWVLVCKAWSHEEGWMKSTKAMQVGGGVLIQVTTQQQNPDGTYSLAESLTFVPGGVVVKDIHDDLVEIMESSQIAKCEAEPLPKIPEQTENEPPRLADNEDIGPVIGPDKPGPEIESGAEETQEVGDEPTESWDEVTD